VPHKAKELELRIESPPSVEDVASFVERVVADLASIEQHYRTQRKRQDMCVKGAATLRAEPWCRRPKKGAKLFQIARRRENGAVSKRHMVDACHRTNAYEHQDVPSIRTTRYAHSP
jgi:hypothetical protein